MTKTYPMNPVLKVGDVVIVKEGKFSGCVLTLLEIKSPYFICESSWGEARTLKIEKYRDGI